MPTKEERAKEASKHIALMKSVFGSQISESIGSTKVYEEGQGPELDIPEPRHEKTSTFVTTDFAALALYDKAEGKTMVVDAGAFTKPGGNYEAGSFGPEQSLCAESDLYPILQGLVDKYYNPNRHYSRGQLYTDRCAYIPNVMFSRSGSVQKADVLVIAAPNRERALQNHRDVKECDSELERRIEAILRIAAENEVDSVIVGAFGCGFLGNDTNTVVGLFKSWLDAHPGMFAKVIFSVPRSEFDAFDFVFGAPKVEQKVQVVDDDVDGDDDGFVLDFDLPEGITFH